MKNVGHSKTQDKVPKTPVPLEGPSEAKKKALEMLVKMDAMDRVEARKRGRSVQHTLPAILLPLWIWVLGLVFLPEETPRFAKALFHASSLGGFFWLAYSAWRHAREISPERKERDRKILEEDIELARRRKELRDM